jgi:hypothetical protein
MRLRRKLEYSPSKGNAVCRHPQLLGRRVLMNKIFNNSSKSNVTVPIPVYQSEGLVWLKAAQPQFFDIFSKMIFCNLERNDLIVDLIFKKSPLVALCNRSVKDKGALKIDG